MQISEKCIYLNDEIHRVTQKIVKYPNTFWQMMHVLLSQCALVVRALSTNISPGTTSYWQIKINKFFFPKSK